MEINIREYPCCMCPAEEYDFQDKVCSGNETFLGKEVGPCNFVNKYVDKRGWTFFVSPGIGGDTYKAFYKKPNQRTMGHAYKNLPWRTTFKEAQEDLNKLAIEKGWKICHE